MKTIAIPSVSRILLFFIVLFSGICHAQDLQKVISQLKEELTKTTDEQRKAVIFSDLTWYYSSVSIDSALAYGKKAEKTAADLGNENLLSQIYSDLGAVYFRQNDFKNSEKNYLKSYKIRETLNNRAGMAKLNNNLASVYQSTFQYKKAMEMYLQALKYFESTKDEKNINITKQNLGLLFVDLKNFDQAIVYIKESIDYFESQEKSVDNENKRCENYLNLGKAYQQKKDFANAQKYYEKSAAICKSVGNKQGIAFTQRNLANLSIMKNKKADSADLVRLEESKKIRKEFNSKVDIESNQLDVAQGYITQRKFQEAKKVLLKVLPVFVSEQSQENELSAYKLLTTIYNELNNSDSADYYFNRYLQVNENLVNTSVIRQSTELEKKYQTLKKDKEILENRSQILHRNIYIFSLLGLLALAVGYYRNYQHRQKIRLQKEILHQQDLATRAVMNAEDNERKRMASHLHDGIGQMLTATHMNLMVLEEYKDADSDMGDVIGKTKKILKDAMVEVRTLSHQMMPNMLIKNSLSNALKELIDQSSTPKLAVHLQLDGLMDNLDENIQIVLYRVIQECINNTLKHAEATEIFIRVQQTKTDILAYFKDNGKGFNPEATSSKSFGMGLENIRSRIEFLKGLFLLNSGAGQGTEITVKIPL